MEGALSKWTNVVKGTENFLFEKKIMIANGH